jgi:hypothetical protein
MEDYKCNEVLAEDGEDFQEYIKADGSLVKTGELVGFELTINGETEFYLLDGIFYHNN